MYIILIIILWICEIGGNEQGGYFVIASKYYSVTCLNRSFIFYAKETYLFF